MKIVALSGWKRSGKDTAARYLIETLGYKRFGFADILKEMVAEQYAIPLEWLHNEEFKELPLSKFPVDTTDRFAGVIHDFMDGEFKEIKIEEGDECSFVKCWTPRALAILEGSVKRSVNSQYWVQRVVDQIIKEWHESAGEVGKFVITDLRYQSEAGQLRKAFGEQLTTVRINRFEDCESTDPSERDLDDYDFDKFIDNTLTLEDLFSNVEKAVGE